VPLRKIISIFDDRDSLERAREALVEARLGTVAIQRIDPREALSQSVQPSPNWYERLRELFQYGSARMIGDYAEALRRGSLLFMAIVPEAGEERARQMMQASGAIDLRRRVRRWRSSGWDGFDPKAPPMSEGQIEDERAINAAEPADKDDITSGANLYLA